MSVWFVIPSKRPLVEANACLEAWHDMGYLTAVLREFDDGLSCASVQKFTNCYQGWAKSVNVLVNAIMVAQDKAQWFVTGGDDYYPDPTRRADEIASECEEHFNGLACTPDATIHETVTRATFGVMQPTGDRWGEERCKTCSGTGSSFSRTEIGSEIWAACPDCQGSGRSAVIDRICGSPWMGREFCRRMYHGGGPLYNGYYHNFADEELQNVARRLGVLWQRRDLTQEHRHWAAKQPKSTTHTGLAGDVRNMPEWARKINDPESSDWERSKALFAKRKAKGFPGHEPLEI